MKKINKILVILFLAFTFCSVFAAENKCEYNNDLDITFDLNGVPTVNSSIYKEHDTPDWFDWLINNRTNKVKKTDKLQKQEKELIGMCPSKVYLCEYEEYSIEYGLKKFFSDESSLFNHLQLIYLFYGKKEMEEDSSLNGMKDGEWDFGNAKIDSIVNFYSDWSDYDIPVLREFTGLVGGVVGFVWEAYIKGTWASENFYAKYKHCYSADYKGDPSNTYNLACPNVNIYLGRFNTSLNEYIACGKSDTNCIATAAEKMNKTENQIKDICSDIFQGYDYEGDVEQNCLETCINISDQLEKLKKKAKLNSGDPECGLSGRLIVWIGNIVRWLKYIIPVIVIILGILDFIKALGADKDDELKKAQKRFIIRLVAAALIFILPFIIEFALDKLGFGMYIDGCGIIDL